MNLDPVISTLALGVDREVYLSLGPQAVPRLVWGKVALLPVLEVEDWFLVWEVDLQGVLAQGILTMDQKVSWLARF